MSAFTSLSRLISHRQRLVLLLTALMFIALCGGWFDPGLTPRLSSWKVGMFQQPSVGHPHFNLLSFGTVGCLLLYFLWRAALAEHRKLIILLSVALLFLSFNFYLQIGIFHPSWLKWGVDGGGDFRRTMSFVNTYSIGTQYLHTPNSGAIGDNVSVPDRLLATYSCLSFGWLWFTLAALATLVISVTTYGEQASVPSRHSGARWAAVGAIILGLQLIAPLLGQYYVWRGDHIAMRNDGAGAVASYRHAIWLDQWYQLEPYLYLKIGTLRRGDGDRNGAESLFAQGVDLYNAKFYQEGMDALERARAATKDVHLQGVILDEIANIATTQGATFFQAGAQSLAQHEWLRALQARPARLAPTYMIGRSNQDLTNYSSARQWYLQTQSRTQLKVVKAACMSAIGDTYYLSGQTDVARDYYQKSMMVSYNLNFRGMKSLLDDYYQ